MEVNALDHTTEKPVHKWALPLFMIGVFMAALDNGTYFFIKHKNT